MNTSDTYSLGGPHRSDIIVMRLQTAYEDVFVFGVLLLDMLVKQYRANSISGRWNNCRSVQPVFLTVRPSSRLLTRAPFRSLFSQWLRNRGTHGRRVKRRSSHNALNTNTIRHFLLNLCILHSHSSTATFHFPSIRQTVKFSDILVALIVLHPSQPWRMHLRVACIVWPHTLPLQLITLYYRPSSQPQ